MRIVVGLGNPGKAYEGTPHNAGFAVVDRLARRMNCPLRRSLRFAARIGKVRRGDDALWLVQPRTFMNNSGAAAAAILRYQKLAPHELIAVTDDADLPLGRIRVRPGGGSGGHKGLASLIQQVGTDAFARVRVGVGRDRPGGRELVEYVLAPLSPEERKRLTVVVDRAADAVIHILDRGVEEAMNRFNGLDLLGAAEAGFAATP